MGEVDRARDEDSLRLVPLRPILEQEVSALSEAYPAATFTTSIPDSEIQVLADHRLRLLVRKLLELNANPSEGSTVTVDVGLTQNTVSLSASTTGDSVADIEGSANEPAVDFDHRIVELLTDYYGGTLEIASPDSQTDDPRAVDLDLLRATGEQTAKGQLGVASAGLGAAIGGGIVAGLVMGVLSQVLAGLLPVIGSLYGVSDPIVGWITHLFHSVVFALLFGAGYTHFRAGDPHGSIQSSSLFGAGWGLVLWLVAAGLIMPLWLRLMRIPSELPNLNGVGLLTHVVWGLVLGAVYVPLRQWLQTSDRWDRFKTIVGRRVGWVLQ